MKDLGRPTTNTTLQITGRSTTASEIKLTHNTWLLGVTVGVPFFAGAILGLIVTDPVTKILGFGRRGAICVAGAFSLMSVVGSASVQKWEHLLGFRILLGAGMAGKASIVPILLSETSPKNVRGILLVFWQLSVSFGLFAGSVANLSVYKLNTDASWRYMFIAAVIPALLLLSLILFSPGALSQAFRRMRICKTDPTSVESPRWLLKESGANESHDNADRRRRDLVRKAYLALFDLRGEPVPILVASELYLLYTRLIEEQRRLRKDLPEFSPPPAVRNDAEGHRVNLIEHISWRPRVQLMFFKRGTTRRAHLAAAAVMISQQLCGINLLAFLADTFFRYSILSNIHEATPEQTLKVLGSTVALMGVSFIATFVALFFIDRGNGRRTLLNCSFPCMAISLLGSALVLLNSGREPSPIVIAWHYIFLITFIIAYSIGEGPAAFVISAEVFPLVNRELGMSLAVFWNFSGAGLLAVVAPVLWNKLDQFGVLMLFAGTNLLAWFICDWLVPNTGNENLEDVFEQLEVETGFLFWYTLRNIFRRTTKPLEWCCKLGYKPWAECGYGEKLGLRRNEFLRYQAKGTSTEPNTERGSDVLHMTHGRQIDMENPP
jgi:MFS family permease